MKRLILALACAILPTPVVAQTISRLPAASTPSASDQTEVIQGSGCATQVQPCVNARMSLPQISSYIASDPAINGVYAKLTGGIFTGPIQVNGDITYTGSPGIVYTPTVSCISGTLSSLTATAKYKQIGKMVFVKGSISIGSSGNGSCGSAVVVSLPFSSSNDNIPSNGSGRENAATFKQLQVVIGSNQSTAIIVNFDNSYPGGNGYVLLFSIVYEAQ